jgi:hypothetical protein
MAADSTTCEVEVRGSNTRTGGEGYPCPVCGGGLVPLRSMWRCGRCSFVQCVGCEPELVCVVRGTGEE